jgi:two-component system chemotaxis sensor kinase CheA
LHGKGKFSGAPKQDVEKTKEVEKAKAKAEKTKEPAASEKKPDKKKPEKAKKNAGPAKGAAAKKAPSSETTVRVDTARLDDIMNMVGELVLVRNRLATLRSRLDDEEVATAVSNLDVVTSDLQNSVMKTRMLPVKKVFGRFPRVVRDLARNLKKEIELEMEGEETDLDKNLVEALADPMVHLVRNAVDHGIELPDEREKAGKPRSGTVKLSAAQEGDHILLTITDDGKGMDPEILREKAVEKGMMDEETAARLTNKDLYNLIFHPGFSTKTEISDVSGRGVGMDVVKTRIAQMNGSVEIDSELGTGSIIIIKLPLTLAILPTLMVKLSTQPFALPLSTVVEIFNLDLEQTNVVDGQLTIMVRERALPLFYLREWLIGESKAVDNPNNDIGHVVVVNVGGIQVGLVVDHLIGQEEVVIKPLGAMLQGLEGMAGATITGDGNIALILDVPGLLRKYARKF